MLFRSQAMAETVQPLLAGEGCEEQLDTFDKIHSQLKQGYAEKSATALLQLARGELV